MCTAIFYTAFLDIFNFSSLVTPINNLMNYVFIYKSLLEGNCRQTEREIEKKFYGMALKAENKLCKCLSGINITLIIITIINIRMYLIL